MSNANHFPNFPTQFRRPEATPERVQDRPVVAPRVDVYENKDELLILADVPGATKDTVNVHLDKGQLTLEAKRTLEAPTSGKETAALLAGEARLSDYQRVFSVPPGIDASKIEADLHAGVLRIRLPKADALKPRRIAIKAS